MEEQTRNNDDDDDIAHHLSKSSLIWSHFQKVSDESKVVSCISCIFSLLNM
jgi:hypothetical protein